MGLFKKPERYIPVFFLVAAVILFFPSIHRSFSSDDFLVLKRIALDNMIWVKGFFRPLSDISLYVNYRIGGFNPAGYYLFNIILHGVNSYLLFLFCLKWNWTTDMKAQKACAFIAGLLFLTYPFHSESINWILGRASLMADTFGLAALLVLVSNIGQNPKIAWACFFYFIGLASYESIMMLPLMVIVLLYEPRKSNRFLIYLATALFVTLFIHLVVRREVAGVVVGSYGEGFFSQHFVQYAGNLLRVSDRLFLPPIQSFSNMILCFSGFVLSLIIILLLVLNSTKQAGLHKIYLSRLFLLLILSASLPVLLGVSTKTSESDRFLYFPSYFLCFIFSFLITSLVTRYYYMVAIVFLIGCWNIYFLKKNMSNWNKASEITKNILSAIQVQDKSKHLFIINLPDEFDGAYIFRLGFQQALQIYGMDTARCTIVNHLKREDMIALPDSIIPQRSGDMTFISPAVAIHHTNGVSRIMEEKGRIGLTPDQQSIVLYWDKRTLKVLALPH